MYQTTFVTLFLVFFAHDCFAQKGKPIYLQNALDAEVIANLTNKQERFKQQLIGHFSNKEYVRNNPTLGEKEQEFIAIPIFKDHPNEFWVYLEFFSPKLPDAPIEQRIQRYVRANRDSTLIEVYYLKQPALHINEWKKQEPFSDITKKDLVRDSLCDLYLVSKLDDANIYETLPAADIACALRSVSGTAQYFQLAFEASVEGYNMFFKYYDKNKQLVRQTDYNGVLFERLDYRKTTYINYAPDVKIKKQKNKKPKPKPKSLFGN